MKTDNNFVKFKVCCNHILENKKILSFLLKEFIPTYHSFSVDEVERSFLTDDEVRERGEEVVDFLKARAQYLPKDLSDYSNRIYTLKQPGRNRLNELVVSVYPKVEDKEAVIESLEASFKESMKLFGSLGLWENNIFSNDGNFIHMVINFFIIIFAGSEGNQVYSNIRYSLKEPTLVHEYYPFPGMTATHQRFIPIVGFLLGPYDPKIDTPGLKLLDLIFSGDFTVHEKEEILKNEYQLKLGPDETEDLSVITSYCRQVSREAEPKLLL